MSDFTDQTPMPWEPDRQQAQMRLVARKCNERCNPLLVQFFDGVGFLEKPEQQHSSLKELLKMLKD